MCLSIIMPSRSASSHTSRRAQVLCRQVSLNVSDVLSISDGSKHLSLGTWNKPRLFLRRIQLINDYFWSIPWNIAIKRVIETWSMFCIEMVISKCFRTFFYSCPQYPVIGFQSWEAGNHTNSLTQRLSDAHWKCRTRVGFHVHATFQSYTCS